MSETTSNEPGKPRRRWMGPLLIVSLAVNLLVLGAVSSWAWRHGAHGPWHGSRSSTERILWLVPEAKRDAAAAIIARYQGEQDARAAEVKAAEDAVIAVLRAEPFSRPALEQALSRTGSAELARRLQPAMLAEIVETLSPAERKMLADNVEQLMERRARRRGGSS
jgi:uncharacterized membrane protein